MASAYKFRMAGMEAELPATTAHQAPVPRTGTSEKAGIRRRRADAQPRSAFFPSGEHASGARNSEGAADARAPTCVSRAAFVFVPTHDAPGLCVMTVQALL